MNLYRNPPIRRRLRPAGLVATSLTVAFWTASTIRSVCSCSHRFLRTRFYYNRNTTLMCNIIQQKCCIMLLTGGTAARTRQRGFTSVWPESILLRQRSPALRAGAGSFGHNSSVRAVTAAFHLLYSSRAIGGSQRRAFRYPLFPFLSGAEEVAGDEAGEGAEKPQASNHQELPQRLGLPR